MNVTPTDPGIEELAQRHSDGLEVTLLWHRLTDRLTVTVGDARTGELFEIRAPKHRALEVFNHPFAYAV